MFKEIKKFFKFTLLCELGGGGSTAVQAPPPPPELPPPPVVAPEPTPLPIGTEISEIAPTEAEKEAFRANTRLNVLARNRTIQSKDTTRLTGSLGLTASGASTDASRQLSKTLG